LLQKLLIWIVSQVFDLIQVVGTHKAKTITCKAQAKVATISPNITAGLCESDELDATELLI